MTLFFKESKGFLTHRNENFLTQTVLNVDFPFFLQGQAVSDNQKDFYLTHKVLNRLEQSDNHQRTINTDIEIYTHTLDILNNFCDSIGVKPYFYTRAGYNLTFNCGFDKCEPHQDHEYDHKQIIIYLNDSDATTCILDGKKVIKEIKPEQGKGICFNNVPHYQHYPKSGARLVLVATFI